MQNVSRHMQTLFPLLVETANFSHVVQEREKALSSWEEH